MGETTMCEEMQQVARGGDWFAAVDEIVQAVRPGIVQGGGDIDGGR